MRINRYILFLFLYLFVSGMMFLVCFVIDSGIFQNWFRYNYETLEIFVKYKIKRWNGNYYGELRERKDLEENFYKLMLLNARLEGNLRVKKDLVDVMILLKKYKMAGYVIESEIKEVVDKDRYLEKYTPLLSYIYYKVGDKDKSEKYMSEFISHLKGIRKIEEEREEIEKKKNEILKKKGRYFKYKKDYYDFLLKRLKDKNIFP